MGKAHLDSDSASDSGDHYFDASKAPAVHEGEKADFAELKHTAQQLDASFTNEDLELITAHLDDRTFDQALEIVKQAVVDHNGDPCVDRSKYDTLEALSKGPLPGQTETDWEYAIKFEAFLIEDWSIYPEVRAATRPIDEPGEYAETLRVYVLGIIWACAGACLDTFFQARFPAVSISLGAIQIILLGCGRLWSLLPRWSIPLWKGKKLAINPGPWTFKEQMLATLTVSVSLGSPYAQYAIFAQNNEYFFGIGEAADFGYMIMIILSSAFMGFGVAGLMRVFLVYPENCVWYSVLPTITLNRALMGENDQRTNINGWKLFRIELFWIAGWLMFIWYWITNFVFVALSYFDWPAWIAPDNVNLQAMTGMISGLGVNPWSTFDFNIANSGGMIAPLYATMNQMFGIFISFFAIVIIWYTNVRWSSYIPVNTNTLFANDGNPFRVTKLLNENNILDEEKYQNYSLPFYSAGNIVNYGAFFMFYPAMIVYAILNYGSQLIGSTKLFIKTVTNPRKALESCQDRFSRAQRAHKEVPEWWFLALLLGSLGMAIATVEHYKFTQTPVWTIFFGMALAIVFTIPTGLLYSTTNYSMDINVLFELIIGYALPGNGGALMVSKVYATNFLSQTDNYITNQKQSHYTGIAPRSLFRLQFISVICTSFVQAGLIYWQLNGGVHELCSPTNRQKFTCQGTRTYFNAAVIWGVIGPRRVFNFLYPTMKWCFLIGACIPLVLWAARRFLVPRYKSLRWLNDINEIVIMVGCIAWAPYNFSYYLPNMYLALFFNGFVKRRSPLWWRKYNYILYNGWMVGIVYAALIMFFATEYNHVVSIDWWGNNVPFENGDAEGTAVRLLVPDVGYFGPEPGTYP